MKTKFNNKKVALQYLSEIEAGLKTVGQVSDEVKEQSLTDWVEARLTGEDAGAIRQDLIKLLTKKNNKAKMPKTSTVVKALMTIEVKFDEKKAIAPKKKAKKAAELSTKTSIKKALRANILIVKCSDKKVEKATFGEKDGREEVQIVEAKTGVKRSYWVDVAGRYLKSA
jgi:hypothetical protein